MKDLNPIEQEKILDKTYVSVKDIYKLYPFGFNAAIDLFNEIKKELIEQGIPLMPCRPAVVPLELVLKKWMLDEGKIKRASNRLKKEAQQKN